MHIGDKYKVYQREANDSLHDTPRGEKGENTLMKESLIFADQPEQSTTPFLVNLSTWIICFITQISLQLHINSSWII